MLQELTETLVRRRKGMCFNSRFSDSLKLKLEIMSGGRRTSVAVQLSE